LSYAGSLLVACAPGRKIASGSQATKESTMGIVSSKPEHRWPGRRIPFVIDDNDFPPNSP